MVDPKAVLARDQVACNSSIRALGLNTLLLFPWFFVWLLAALPAIRDGHVDFREHYAVGYMVRSGHGHEIYDYSAQKRFQDQLVSRAQLALPFVRPAYQALLFAPFSFLPFRQAYFAFFVFNLAVLTLCFRILRPYMARLARTRAYLPAVVFLFVPIAVALIQGQDSIILLTLLAGALACIQMDREYLAGVLVAFGLIKFQLVIPIALLFLIWRRWRFSTAFACTAVLLAAISIWIAGTAQSVHYVTSMIQMGSSLNFSSGSPVPVNQMANLHGAIYGMLGRSPYVLPLTLASSAAMIIYASFRRPHGVNAFLIAIPVSVAVSYHLGIHDMCVLLIPIVLVLDRIAEEWTTKHQYGLMRMASAVLLFGAPMCLLFAMDRFWIASLPLLAFAFATLVPQRSDFPLCDR
jgi:hypothetical protein